MAKFNTQKHITYWLRCLKTFLPAAYTSMDSNRTMLAFFILSALDILGALNTSVSEDERTGYVDWIYSTQHANGGFRGSPSFFPMSDTQPPVSEEAIRSDWDPASVPATYFALATLAILRDDLSRVDREKCLAWLRQMQRADGSFGQTLRPDRSVDGGHDTRFGYVAMGIRWMLGGDIAAAQAGGLDVDVEGLVANVKALQTYDGGFGDEPFHEAHGGYTYCAVAALSLANGVDEGVQDRELLLRWLVARQTGNLDPEEDVEEDLTIPTSSDPLAVGFNGRCNKIGDTCYTFWIAATLKSLSQLSLLHTPQAIEYLLAETQHFIGGFMKYPGDPPDIYHSYLGLAALGVLGLEGISAVDPVMSFGIGAVEFLKEGRARWR